MLSVCSLEPFLRSNVHLYKNGTEYRNGRVYDGVKLYLSVEKAIVGERLDIVLDLDAPVAPIVRR